MEITQELYDKVRKYALRIDRNNGEDACQEVCSQLVRKGLMTWNPPVAISYLFLAVKREVWRIQRSQKSELMRLYTYYRNDPIPVLKGLKLENNSSRMKRTRCRKNFHDLTEDNIVYVGARRTCKACWFIRRESYKRKKALVGVI